ncbi:hypothetical protein DRO02_07770 [archaeon]|nr:MAG: hypothetical protein DRO02_07770 [archaeon]
MNFQSASDIEHAADEIAKFLCEASSSYIGISIFLDTKEIENIKKSISSVGIGILRVEVYQMTDGVWVLRPAECEGIQGNSANQKEGEVMFFVEGWDERGVRAGSFVMVEETDKYYG